MTQLNQASKKKIELQAFGQKLGVSMSGMETIPQMQKAAMVKIYDVSAPHSNDPVGFGKAASLTYQEAQMDTQYCQWVLKTWEEGPTCAQLARFARWLQSEKNKPSTPDETMSSSMTEPDIDVKKTMTAKVKTAASEKSGSNTNSMMLEVMQQMMTTMQEIKEEMSELSPQRPRKKKEGKDDSSRKIDKQAAQ